MKAPETEAFMRFIFRKSCCLNGNRQIIRDFTYYKIHGKISLSSTKERVILISD